MIRCIYSPFTDIYFHLAAEEYLLKQGNDDIFMLWQDTPSVVIGKHQRLRSEVDTEWAEQEQIHIARRFSGGGTVYHDMGNVNLTFNRNSSRACLNLSLISADIGLLHPSCNGRGRRRLVSIWNG